MAFSTVTAGSWHNEGFYGHNRSKTRNDVVNEYRHLAKPTPPKKFVGRASEPATAHVFSHHDNRERFLSDALYFEQGLGRRRFEQKPGGKQLIVWHPHARELSLAPPQISSYREVYHPDSHPHRQHYAHLRRPRTATHRLASAKSASGQPQSHAPAPPRRDFTTSYTASHCTEAPFKESFSRLNRACTQSALCNRVVSRAHSARYTRETVASCMSWHRDPAQPTPSRPQSAAQNEPAKTAFQAPAPPAGPKPANAGDGRLLGKAPQATAITVTPAAGPLPLQTAVKVAVPVI